MSIADRVHEVIAEHFGLNTDEVKAENDLVQDLGGDSLDEVEIVMALEDEFRIEISDSEAASLTTVGKITEWLEARVKS